MMAARYDICVQEVEGKRNETKFSLPEEVGHVSVWAVDSTESRKKSHESHTDHTHAADELFYGQDP